LQIEAQVKKRTSINSIPNFHKEKEMADFRKLYYALATVGLFVGLTASASAQSLNCQANNGTNQIIRAEGDAELVGDIVLACSQPVGSTFTTPPGTVVLGADITVSIPATIITSKIINPGSSTPLSEATLIVDDLKDQTCAQNGLSIGNPVAPAGTACESDSANVLAGGAYWPGSRTHRVCSDTTNPGGLGVCQVVAQASGPQDTYDGSAGHPNIFVGQPNGTGAVIFRGVPLDPPGTNFTRYLRITNIRVNAAATGLTPGNPLSLITAVISFQGSASIQLQNIQTTVAVIQTGNGGTTTTPDSSFLQCEYPLFTFQSSDLPVTQDCGISSSTSASSGGTSSGQPTSALLQGFCTVNSKNANAGLSFNNTGKFSVAQFKEGFQSAWKARNMSEYLGTGGTVLSTTVGGANACPAIGSPCDGGGNNNNVNSTLFQTYNGSSTPNVNTTDISQDNPQARFFTEGGFTEQNPAYTTGGAFSYSGTPWNQITPGAGVADQGTRLQATITNIPANAVVSLPTVVWLWNGSLNSGVAVLVNTTSNGGGALSPVSPSSALPSVQVGVTANPSGYTCNGNGGGTAPGPTKLVACNGYVDVTGPSATFTYEVIFSDPYSNEVMDVIPVVYFPAGELTSKPQVLPQTNIWSQISPYTFAPWIAQPGGNQVTNPLGQVAGTPRFLQTTGTALNFIYVNNCTCSLLFPWVVSDNNYVTGIVVSNTSADPTNALSIPGYSAVQENGTVKLYLFGTISGKTAQTNTSIAAAYPGTDTQALAGSYATFIVNTGFDGYAITQANFQYCHGLAFLFNATGAVPPLSYLGLVMDPAGLVRTTQTVGDPLGQ
jgi:hypothetical protein